MKIFVAEYIIMYEALDFDFFFEKNVGCHYHVVNYFESLHPYEDRFCHHWWRTYTEFGCRILHLRRKQWAHHFLWYRKWRMYFMLYTAQAPYFMGYKWFRKYTWWHGYKLPMIWKYIEYQHLNHRLYF